MTPGTRVGPYEIVAKLGEGGMGEVFRARDTRLDRVVAIKVLSASLADDPQRRERFEREARAISALNHPHICVLYDIGTADQSGAAVDYLVMEHLEGETLAARLERGPLKVDDALTIAIQMASALDRAHAQGIVHRDLKPGNIMLTKAARATAVAPSGSPTAVHVKLLDFGLARFTQRGIAERSSGSQPGMVSIADLTMPTVSSPLTMKGTIVGTLSYMAPEQLEAKDVDWRADLFAFGVVLYEMLTERRPFEGKSQASLIGAILDHEPAPARSVRPEVPLLLDELVSRCLSKSADDRWQSTRDLLRQLEWIASHRDAALTTSASGVASPQLRKVTRFYRIAAATGVVAVLASAIAVWSMWPQAPPPPGVARFVIELPGDQVLTRTGRRALALSPDGQTLAYVANQQIFRRALNEINPAPVAGTEGTDPSEPTFSPDGRSIAFWASGYLKKVPTSGGTPITLCEAQNPNGVSWDGDRILWGQRSQGVMAVASNGGLPVQLVAVNENAGELAQSPQLVADGRAVLFTLKGANQAWDDASIVVEDLATKTRTVLIKGGTNGRVLPSGQLVYARGSTLFAVPFDDLTLAVTGSAVPVQQDIELAAAGFSGAAQISWSATGSMVFLPSGLYGDRALTWIDRQGQIGPAGAPHREYAVTGAGQLDLSPDGSRAAVTVINNSDSAGRSGTDIWLWDVARSRLTALTSSRNASQPVWSNDGKRICYQSAPQVFCQSADGTGQPESVLTIPDLVGIGSLTPDRQHMLIAVKGAVDIALATLGSSGGSQPLTDSRGLGVPTNLILSPDGRWLAYTSNEGGLVEVVVRPFPNVNAGKWQVSSGGGTDPRWAHDGRTLYYLDVTGSQGSSAARTIMAAAIQPGPSFQFSQPVQIVKYPPTAGRSYDVAPDGRFLIALPVGNGDGRPQPVQLVLVQHWFDELKFRMTSTNK
jgi:serine/threonine-protein kinase